MKMHLLITVIILICTYALSAQNELSGEWLGDMDTYNGKKNCRLVIKGERQEFTVYNDIAQRWKVEDIKINKKVIHFNTIHEPREIKFEGQFSPGSNQITGSYQNYKIEYSFKLVKRQRLDSLSRQPYLGYYKTKAGTTFQLLEHNNTFHLHSPISGEYIVMKHVGEDRFMTRTGECYQFKNKSNGLFQELIWSDIHGHTLSANRYTAFDIENVVIYTSIDTIHGSLYVPIGQPKSPATMLALGAGRVDRWGYVLEAELFASQGVASLIVDFPGTGKSSGVVGSHSFKQKKEMTQDIFRWLQKHRKIDPNKICIRGGSQSGRIAIMAASELSDIAGVIAVNVPIIPRAEQQVYAIAEHLRSREIDELTISDVSHVWRTYFRQVNDQKIDTGLIIDIQNLRSNHANLILPDLTSTTQTIYERIEDNNTTTIESLSKIKCPVMFQLAMEDERVPYISSLHNIREAMEANPNKNMTIVNYQMANHNLMIPGYQIIPRLFTDKMDWFREVVAP